MTCRQWKYNTRLLITLVVLWPTVVSHATTDRPPNIVFILVDDLGWNELGCYGDSFFETPHLDRLAAQGMRFTNAYAPSPICSSSRAAFLTGRSPARLGFEFVIQSKNSGPEVPNAPLLTPPYAEQLALDEVTIGEALQEAGYVTGFFGKWHVNQHHQGYLGWSPTHGPLAQGFLFGDVDRGSHPYTYSDRGFGDFQSGEYPPHAMTEKAIDFLKNNKGRPMLLYYSSYYVHNPVHTRCKWLYDKFADKPDATGAPADRAMYGAFVAMMDHYIGQLLGSLDELGLSENTVVIFTSDNGGSPAYHFRSVLRGSKWNLYEGGIRVPLIVRWPAAIQSATVCDIPVAGMDIFPTICQLAGVAPAENRPLDGVSIVPLLRDASGKGWNRDTLYWHFPYYIRRVDTRPQSAIRQGDWKLIYHYEDHRVELYNLANDIGEKIQRRWDQPEKVQLLREALARYLKSVEARMPTPNPEYDPDRGAL